MDGAQLNTAQCPLLAVPHCPVPDPVCCASRRSCLKDEIVPPGPSSGANLLVSLPSLCPFHLQAAWQGRGVAGPSGTPQQEGYTAAPGGLPQVQPICFPLPAFRSPSVFCLGSAEGRGERWVSVGTFCLSACSVRDKGGTVRKAPEAPSSGLGDSSRLPSSRNPVRSVRGGEAALQPES